MNDNDHNKDEDIVYEDEPSEESSFRSKKDRDEDTRTKLTTCNEERQKYLEGWQRAKADLINARREFDSEREKIKMLACERLVEDLIPTLDSFEMAMKNKKMWESLDEVWRQGMEHIYREFKEVLTSHGLTEMNPVDKKFNPAEHESVSTKPAPEKKKDGVIAEVMQRGYKLHSKIIRAPKVIIYQDE